LAAAKTLLRPVPLEWLAVIAGLAATGTGMVAGAWAAHTLADDGKARSHLPLGALVVACIPAFWDFATSGLETGLAFAWLGGCFAVLVEARRRAATGGTRLGAPRGSAVLIGIGPLVRPDFLIFTVVFLAVLIVVTRPAGVRAGVGMVAVA